MFIVGPYKFQCNFRLVLIPICLSLRSSFLKGNTKEIQIILRLFLVIALYCLGSSSQIKSISQPPALLAGWEGSLGTCSR